MSKTKTVTYSRTRNLGDFNSVKMEATIELDDGEDRDERYADLRQWVLGRLRAEETTSP